jgi:serine/threonine-protein kinase
MFRAATPDEARGRTLTARELLDRGAQRVDQLTAQPIVQASLLHDIAQAYLDLGLYDQAEPLAERSYNLRAHNLGPRNLQTADTLELLATVLRDKGEYQKAEPLFRQLLAIREEASGTDQRLIAHTLGDLGDCLGQEEKDAESEAVLRRALAIYRHQDPDNGSEARIYLAWVLERKGDFPDAAQLLQEAVEIDRRTKGADSPDYANSLHNLASDLID